MANALFLGWGHAVRGREQVSLQVFNEALQFFTERQQQGDLEAFEPVALEPHGGDLYGFFLIRGDPEKLNRLRSSADFQRLTARGGFVVERLGVVSAFVGDELNHFFGLLQQQTEELGG